MCGMLLLFKFLQHKRLTWCRWFFSLLVMVSSHTSVCQPDGIGENLTCVLTSKLPSTPENWNLPGPVNLLQCKRFLCNRMYIFGEIALPIKILQNNTLTIHIPTLPSFQILTCKPLVITWNWAVKWQVEERKSSGAWYTSLIIKFRYNARSNWLKPGRKKVQMHGVTRDAILGGLANWKPFLLGLASYE